MKYDLNELRENPNVLAEQILKIELHKGQQKILECKDRFIAVRAARRFGKSFVFSVYAIWFAVTNPNKNIVLVSRSQRQSMWLFDQIVRLLTPTQLNSSITRLTMSELEFSNGSTITSLPGASYDSLRGPTIDLALIDEAAYVRDELFSVLYPTVMTTQGRIVLISTPGLSAGEFYNACTSKDSGYTAFKFTHDDAVFADGRPHVPREELERECARAGGADSAFWKREFLVEFTDADGAFFDIKSVQDAMSDNIERHVVAKPNHTYVIGADIGQKNDYTVFAVLDYTNPEACELVDLIRFNGESADTIMQRLHETASKFYVKRVLIDSAGIGQSILEHLQSHYPGIRYEGFNFNRTSKTKLMNNFNILLARRHIKLLQDEDILQEMASFFYKENPTTKHISMAGANGVHDDIPVAIALAVEAAGVIERRGDISLVPSGFKGKNKHIKYNAPGRRVLL